MFFPSIAHAMGGAAQQGGQQGNPIAAFLPLILMFLIFYFLLIRPQQKKAKQHKQLLSELKKGDYVITGGGLYGRITQTDGDVIYVDLGNDNVVKVNRSFISGLAEPIKEGKKSKSE
jgi:preprotein translocase subunit YajC